MSKFKTREMDSNIQQRKEEAFEDIRDKVKGAGQSIRHFVDETGDKAVEIRHMAENGIRQRPLTISLAVFVSGVLLGALIRGR
jgi:hypothetical protein